MFDLAGVRSEIHDRGVECRKAQYCVLDRADLDIVRQTRPIFVVTRGRAG